MPPRDEGGVAPFREELRTWLEANATRRTTPRARISVFSELRDGAADIEAARRWQRTLASGGWGAITWPKEYGGRDAGPLEVSAFAEEIAKFDVPPSIFTIGTGMIGPTLIAHGSPRQCERYLDRMLRGEEIWCQLWSEPDAGSDLAGLRTRAEADGDEYVLNGQKVWTSGAHYSNLGLGILRTNPDVPKHNGISCFVVPMDIDGIEVRPLRQITGGAHFNEVFFRDARVPAANLIGALDDGWRVARTTLMNERLSAVTATSCAEAFASLAGLGRRDGVYASTDRQAMADVYTRGCLIDVTTGRVRSSLSSDGIPGPESSILKLAAAGFSTEVALAGNQALGAVAGVVGEDAHEGGRWADALLGSFAMHIGGGTDEIQRNIIGESVLGLPREPRVDADVPFRLVQKIGVQ